MKKSLGDRLRELRGAESQTAFCLKIQQKQGTYSAWERDEKDPSSSAIALICKATGVSADWLLGLPGASAPAVPSVPSVPSVPPDAASAHPEAYWRALAASQQETIAGLTRLLAAAQKPTAPAARTGGRGAMKTA